jgi:phospholipid/cholesterol/gamma-HCH transport system ATP-binding protein
VTAEAFVEIQDVVFRRDQRVIYDGLTASVPRGKITAIVGPSGTGKTTLLRLIGGQLKPESGDVRVDGLSVQSLKRSALFDLRKRMGMLFQSGALFAELSVFENVAFPLRVHTDLDDDLIRLVVLMKLEAVGLRGAVDLMPSELSGGMQRRVALARAIALDPEMIMYDEPFVGQDPIGLGVLLSLVKQLNQALGLTSLVVSHDLQETLSIADHVIMIANNRVAFQGSPEIMQASDDPLVSNFFTVAQMARYDSIFQRHHLRMPCHDELDRGNWTLDVVTIV